MIRDEAGSHTGREVIAYLWDHGGRIEVHPLPCDSPDRDPTERAWWHLREEITRNHRCSDPEELLGKVFAWLGEGDPSEVEGPAYPEAKAA